MHHLHLDQCPSTQTVLRELMSREDMKNAPILVSVREQSKGHGRSGNKWSHFPNALAFSLALEANPESLPITSLEIAVMISQFIERNYGIRPLLKWPNDLLNAEGLKAGGIICQGQGTGILAVGIGINLGDIGRKEKPGKAFKNGLSCIVEKLTLTEEEYSSIPRAIYEFLLSHRLTVSEVVQEWKSRCAHLGKEVQIEDGGHSRRGTFTGLGPHGEAIIRDSQTGIEQKVFSGNLNFYLMD